MSRKEKKGMVFALLRQTLKTLVKNPLLLVPDIIAGAVSSLLLYLAFLYTGAGNLVSALQAAEQEIMGQLLRDYLSQNIVQLIIAAVSFFVITFLFGVGIDFIRYDLIQQVLAHKKPSIKTAWKERKNYFWDIVLMRIIVFVVGVVGLLFVALVSGIAFVLLKLVVGESIATTGAEWLAILFGVSFVILFALSFLFRFPVMFVKNIKSGVQALQESFRMLRAKPLFTFISGLVILCLIIVSGILGWGIGQLLGDGVAVTVLVRSVIGLVINLWGALFIFARYKEQM